MQIYEMLFFFSSKKMNHHSTICHIALLTKDASMYAKNFLLLDGFLYLMMQFLF